MSACATPSLPSAGPGAEVGRGNALFDRQDYAAALEAYTAAADQLPDSPEVVYNQGVTHYALGDYGEAERLFRQVGRTARDLELVAAARYNLGNSKFQQGMAQRESDLRQALSALQASVAFYQGALELTPHDREAARNIEVVRLAIKDILDQLQGPTARAASGERGSRATQGLAAAPGRGRCQIGAVGERPAAGGRAVGGAAAASARAAADH